MAVAGQRQLGLEFGLVELLLDFEMKGVARQKTRWRQPVERRGGRHDDHVGAGILVALADAPQRRQAFADQILVRRKRVVGQGFPVGEQDATQIGREKRHFVDQALGIGGVGRDDGREPALVLFALAQLGQQQGIGRAGRAGQGVALARLQFG